MDKTHHLPAGKMISHYKIIEKIGSGGMGVVYKAEDTRLNRIVALKFLPAELTQDEDAKNRFSNEARSASALQHSNICTIHDIDKADNGLLFIAMDCYEGITLDKKISSGSFSPEEAVDIAVQIASGLSKAHQQKIIHCDIKPSNILITKDNVVKILDFGLARLSDQITNIKEATSGTLVYMSPEQFKNETLDNRTDIWSLGVVIYEMLTGRVPFKGEYERAVIYNITNEEPEPLINNPAISSKLVRIISKALKKDPSLRYQNIEEMLTDLKDIKTTQVHKEIISRIRRRRTGKKNYRFAGIAAAAVLIIAVWIFWQKGTGGPDQIYKSIAVLPFHPISRSEEDISFADGIHNDILNQVCKISNLKVIARTSVLRYRDTQKSIKEIARELDVNTVLEGSTRRNGDKIRVTAQLINAETEEQLWADTYDREYADIFTIQSDVAEKIAAALKIRLAKDELKSIQVQPTENLEAYEYFKKGEYFWNVSYGWEGNLKAAEMFEKACHIDSKFALSYAWQSISYSTVYFLTLTSNDSNDYDQKSKEALFKATTLSPDLPEVHLAKGNYFAYVKSNADAALKEAEIAYSMRPNDTHILSFMSDIMSGTGKLEEALKIAEKLYQLDPKANSGPFYASWHSFRLGNLEEAERWADVMIMNDIDGGAGHAAKVHFILQGTGNIKKAEDVLAEAEKYVTRDKDYLVKEYFLINIYKRNFKQALNVIRNLSDQEYLITRAMLLRLLNNEKESKAAFETAGNIFSGLIKLNPDNKVARIFLAAAYAGLGKNEMALQELDHAGNTEKRNYGLEVAYALILNGSYDKAIKHLKENIQKDSDITYAVLKLDPFLDPLRKYPEFNKLISKN